MGGGINMKSKIITITLAYEDEAEFAHILHGLLEALPKTHRMSIEQWFDLNGEHHLLKPPMDEEYEEFTE